MYYFCSTKKLFIKIKKPARYFVFIFNVKNVPVFLRVVGVNMEFSFLSN